MPAARPALTHLTSRSSARTAVGVVAVAIDVPAALGPALGEERTELLLRSTRGHVAAALGAAALTESASAVDIVAVLDADGLAGARSRLHTALAVAGDDLGLRGPVPARTGVARPGTDGDDLAQLVTAALAGAGIDTVEDERRRMATVIAGTLALHEGVGPAHPWHVGEIARRLAEALRLPVADVADVQLAGLLHDVGKLSIPRRILTCPGQLDAGSRAVMQRHSEAGAAFLARLPSLAHLVPTVLHHHEHVDGSGYPHGLAGDAIPFAARIVAVADAYSAITANRPYRAARSVEAAVLELRRVAGSQLDPAVVEALHSIVVGY
jgi:HD-GYP domain-containing protein (c-di-GMP phosphodiesterase class II)